MSFLSIRIEYQHARRPESVETMKVSGMFFDVCFERDEVVVDECRGLIVAVGFGFQPNTCASRGSSAEIYQYRFLVCFSLAKCGVCVCQPMYFHPVHLLR
jgi:hypothetical protein